MTEEIEKKILSVRESVSDVVGELSGLVLASVKGKDANVKQLVSQLKQATNVMMGVSKKVATDDEGDALLGSVANAFQNISSSMSKYIQVFSQYLRAPTDVAINQLFVQQSRELGNSINSLLNIVDSTSKLRLGKLIKGGVLTMSQVEQNLQDPKCSYPHLSLSCQDCSAAHTKLVTFIRATIETSTNTERIVLLEDGINLLDRTSILFIDEAKRYNRNPRDPQNVVYQQNALAEGKTLAKSFGILLKAIKLPEKNLFQQFYNAIEYIQVIVTTARNTGKAMNALNGSIQRGFPLEKVKYYADVSRKSLADLMAKCKKVREKEEDSTKRAFLEQIAWDIEDCAADIIKTYELVKKQDPEAKEISMARYEEWEKYLDKILTGDESEDIGFQSVQTNFVKLADLDDIIPTDFGFDSGNLEDQTVTSGMRNAMINVEGMNMILDRLVSDTFDPAEKSRLANSREDIIDQASKLIVVTQDLHDYPSAENQALFEETSAALELLLGDQTRMKLFSATHLGIVSQNIGGREQIVRELGEEYQKKPRENPLIAVVKEQILAAFNLVREADRVAYMTENFDLQDNLDIEWSKLEKTFAPLLEDAGISSKNPSDLQMQENMRMSQRQVNSVAQEIALLTAPDMAPEAVKALEDSTSATGAEATEGIRNVRLFKEIQVEMTGVLESLLDTNVLGQPIISALRPGAETITKKGKEGSAALKALARLTPPDLKRVKQGLLMEANNLADKAIQMNILARMVTSVGKDETGKTKAAVDGMKGILKQADGHLSIYLIKDRIRNTAAQTKLLESIVQEIRTHRSVRV